MRCGDVGGALSQVLLPERYVGRYLHLAWSHGVVLGACGRWPSASTAVAARGRACRAGPAGTGAGMELRVLLLLARLLDPRSWRTRVRQLGVGTGLLAWLWYRSVQSADGAVAVRTARANRRRAAIDADLDARERAYYDATRPH